MSTVAQTLFVSAGMYGLFLLVAALQHAIYGRWDSPAVFGMLEGCAIDFGLVAVAVVLWMRERRIIQPIDQKNGGLPIAPKRHSRKSRVFLLVSRSALIALVIGTTMIRNQWNTSVVFAFYTLCLIIVVSLVVGIYFRFIEKRTPRQNL